MVFLTRGTGKTLKLSTYTHNNLNPSKEPISF